MSGALGGGGEGVPYLQGSYLRIFTVVVYNNPSENLTKSSKRLSMIKSNFKIDATASIVSLKF